MMKYTFDIIFNCMNWNFKSKIILIGSMYVDFKINLIWDQTLYVFR